MLDHLIAIFEMDLEIDKIKTDIGVYGEKYLAIKKIYEEKKAACANLRQQHEILIGEHGVMEEKLTLEESRLQKSKARINEIKTNFEFQAMKREIEVTEKSNAELKVLLEQKSLEKNALFEKLQALQAEVEKLEAELNDAKKLMDQKNSDIESDVKAKEASRKQHEEKVSREILNKYRLIRERKFHDALAAFSEGACQGCYMSLPPQMSNTIVGSEIFQCPYCQRLIYKKRAEA